MIANNQSSARSDEVYFEINIGARYSPTDVSFDTCSKTFRNATDLQYQIILINMITHVATAVDHEVSQGT